MYGTNDRSNSVHIPRLKEKLSKYEKNASTVKQTRWYLGSQFVQ